MSSIGHLPEMELLRGQVADLSRELAERDRVAQDLREQSDLLRAIVAGTAAETGEEFFAALVTHLTSVLKVQYAIIGEVQGDRIKKIHTLAVSAGGTLVDNFEYELAHTPCATALTQTFACFDRDVQATFPQFQRLADLGAESYCAVPIRTKSGAVIGLLVVMDTKPLEHSDDLQSLLGVFAPRVAAEFERRRAEQERAQALADLHNVMETIPDIVFTLNTQGNLVKWNRRLGDVTGYSPEELLNKPALAFVPPEEQTRTAAAIQRAFTEGYAELDGQLLTKDLRLIPYHWTGALLKNPHGEPVGITGIGRDVSDKKRVEAALRASEERYRALYDDTPTMYFTLASDGTVRSVNRFGATQLGYRVEELIGHSVLNLFHECDKEAVLASLSECLATPETTRHWEFRKVRKDGSIISVREAVRVGRSSTGEAVVLVTCEDITERKQVEEALRLAKFSVDRAADAVYWIDPQAKILEVNEAASLMLGYSRDELRAMTVHDLNPDFQADRWPGFWTETKRRGTMVFETAHRAKNGRLIPIEVSVNYLSHEGKEYHCAFVRDITERKRAGEELRKSHSFLRQVIDINPNFIFAKNRDGRFIMANKAVADAYGTTVDDLIGKTDAHFNPNQEEVKFFRRKDIEVLDSLQDLFLSEEVITDSAGRTRWLQTVKRPMLDDDGRATMVLGVATDITERKRMEESLRQRERELQIALQDRERISQDLHDGVLQSLFAVGLTLEVCKSTMSPRARNMSGASLDQAIDQLNRVMREIRNFIAGLGSDLLQGKDLSTALQQMLGSLTENQATRVRLAVEGRAAKAVSAEQSLHLLHVIQEAVSNCIRHGRAQEARVSLKVVKQGVRLSIRDNGRGFNQDAAKGIGHGLANMAARAQKIGGRFTVLSKMNEGTRIVLDLPKVAPDVSR